MQTIVPLYGFGVGGSGGTGATLTVTAPAGATVTVSKDGKSKTKVADSTGLAVFKGLASGVWTLSITDREQTAQKSVIITADYETAISFFAATINITYPADSICTATDGVTTLIAPDTSGAWACVVPNAGTWAISCTHGTFAADETVVINSVGQTENVEIVYGMIYDSGTLKVDYKHIWSGTVAEESDHLLLTSPNSCGIVFDKIDLTEYTSAEFVYSNMTSGATIGFRITDYLSDDNMTDIVKTNSTSTSGTLTLDLSSVSGRYNVYILLYTSSGTKTVKINRVKLS